MPGSRACRLPFALATLQLMKEQFFTKLEQLVVAAKEYRRSQFGNVDPEEATKQHLIEPLLESLGYARDNLDKEFHILGGQVDYLLKHDRPLMFLEAKNLLDLTPDLFESNREQVLGYIRNYRVSPEQVRMERPVTWIVLTNFAQWHFIRVNEEHPSFVFRLDELLRRREELWELLALENVEADRIEELYDQQHKADLDQRFLADLKRWRLIIANEFALRNSSADLGTLTKASQQLLDRFLFCRMLETHRLIEYNRLARLYSHYPELYGDPPTKPFAEVLRESLFTEIKRDFNTELFEQPQLCDQLAIDNAALAIVIGHEPLTPDIAAQCGFEQGQGELLSFKHLYGYDFSRMSGDIMGAVYERFLAHKLEQRNGRIIIEDTDELRKKEGIYYTPRYIVDYIIEHAVREKIRPILDESLALLAYKNYKGARAKILELAQVKVLDPAMGSGSFLLRAFSAFVGAYEKYNAECRGQKRERNGTGLLFDAPQDIAEEIDHLGLRVAQENIFGVDLDEQAVEVARLNLWIRLMVAERDYIREMLRVRTRNGQKPLNLLPHLANNLKRGNSLIDDAAVAGDTAFKWKEQFPEVMQRGGFDCVIGNPPYHMLQPHNTTRETLAYLRKSFVAAEFKIDLFHLFLQRGISLLRDGGDFGYIVPTTILNNVYAESLRDWIAGHCCIEQVAVAREKVFQDADVHTSILILKKEPDSHKRSKHRILTTSDLSGTFVAKPEAFSRTPQASFAKTSGHVWNILINEDNASFIERLSTGFATLEKVSTVNRGLITGDREKYFSSTKKSSAYVPILEGADVLRYCTLPPSSYVLLDKPETAGGSWDPDLHLAPHKIAVRQISQTPTASMVTKPFAVTGNLFTVRGKNLKDELYLLGVINSRLTDFFWRTMFADFKTSFPQVTIASLAQLPIKVIDPKSKNEIALAKQIIAHVETIQEAYRQRLELPRKLTTEVLHSHRTDCVLAHYLQKDYAAAVTTEVLTDDVRRKGFVREILIQSGRKHIIIAAEVSAAKDAAQVVQPVVRLTFANPSLQQFIYASWRGFLETNARKKTWTTGKTPQPIYDLIVNGLQPLAFFQVSAADNLRAIRDLMKSVAKEVGTSDLATVEHEIAETDEAINQLVYQLYGLTEEEIRLVEGRKT
jgi:type I restriction-modification system DNA methylase subunit